MNIKIKTLNRYCVTIQNDTTENNYVNSNQGRKNLSSECTSQIVQQVYEVWGDTPTVEEEPTYPEPSPQPPSEIDLLKKQIALLESSLAATQLYMNKKAGV